MIVKSNANTTDLNLPSITDRAMSKNFLHFFNRNKKTEPSTTQPAASTVSTASTAAPKDKKNSKATKNITLMVIFTSLAFSIGTTPYAVRYILKTLRISLPQDFSDFSLAVLILSHGCNMIIYVLFNKVYRDVLWSYVVFIFRCF